MHIYSFFHHKGRILDEKHDKYPYGTWAIQYICLGLLKDLFSVTPYVKSPFCLCKSVLRKISRHVKYIIKTGSAV